ncbi:MAG: carboxypeptidase-like regulatory domain-containing protein [Tannerella sp.]|nr:carboxypeptidase-like regulatory domain-containing protein [Tannerella sp.]
MAGGLFAQDLTIKGVVKDAKSSEALAYVNVVVQTADSVFVAGATSDDKGKFGIPKVSAGDYRLVVSYIGYVTQYIEVAGLKANITLPDILMEEDAVGLNAVTVTGSAVTTKIDRKLIFPTERQVKASSNGIDLLQQLMLPRLLVNPMMQSISIPGGGEVQLRVNGVKVEISEIQALLPTDIIRVEYHDNPGLRYGNAEVVVDYIVRRHETGGNLGVGIMNSVDLKIFGNNHINGRINHKKSEFSVNYRINQRDARQMWRDNEETFNFADGSTLKRKETGEPGRMQSLEHYLNTTYSYLNENRMFNATFRYFSHNRPHYDYNGKIYNLANPDDYVQTVDHTKSMSYRPALDLYYQENLRNNQTLVVNVVGTYNGTDETRIYRESREDAMLTDIHNMVAGNKYSWTGEGIYEKKLDANSLSAGLRHTQAYSDNTYKNGHEYQTEMQQGETYLYGEWKGKVRKLNYTLGAGVTRSSFRQEEDGGEYTYYTFNPRLAIFHPLPGNSSVRLTARINNNTPSLSNLSAVEQVIDSLQIQRGNSDLKPFLTYQSELNYEWKKGIFYAGVQGKYEYQPSAIMDEKFLEGGKIVQTWDNQQNWQYMAAILNLRVGPVKDILTISFNGGVNHYVSNGNTYRHVYNNPFFNVTLNGNYKNFNAMFLWQKPWDSFYGETMSGGEKLHYLALGYKYREMNFGISAWSPFSNDFRQDTENRSAYASYKRSMYVNDLSRMFLFTFSYNFSFGRSFNAGGKKVNNADDDAGVMKAGK